MIKSKRKVFISRDLKPGSPLFDLAGHLEIIAESLLKFTPVPFSDIPNADWIFFYSQQGVKHFFDQWNNQIGSKCAAFGPKTGEMLKKKGLKVQFTGDGVAESTAAGFQLLCRNQKVLFVRAAHSRKSLQTELEGICEILDLVVYDNQPREEFSIPECNTLIFTSPMNAKSYFQVRQPDPQQNIIAIGDTTRQALLDLGAKEVTIPGEPTEKAIVQLLIDQFSL